MDMAAAAQVAEELTTIAHGASVARARGVANAACRAMALRAGRLRLARARRSARTCRISRARERSREHPRGAVCCALPSQSNPTIAILRRACSRARRAGRGRTPRLARRALDVGDEVELPLRESATVAADAARGDGRDRHRRGVPTRQPAGAGGCGGRGFASTTGASTRACACSSARPRCTPTSPRRAPRADAIWSRARTCEGARLAAGAGAGVGAAARLSRFDPQLPRYPDQIRIDLARRAALLGGRPA